MRERGTGVNQTIERKWSGCWTSTSSLVTLFDSRTITNTYHFRLLFYFDIRIYREFCREWPWNDLLALRGFCRLQIVVFLTCPPTCCHSREGKNMVLLTKGSSSVRWFYVKPKEKEIVIAILTGADNTTNPKSRKKRILFSKSMATRRSESLLQIGKILFLSFLFRFFVFVVCLLELQTVVKLKGLWWSFIDYWLVDHDTDSEPTDIQHL